MTGTEVVEKLKGLTDGEYVVIDGETWTSLGTQFHVEDGAGEFWVGIDEVEGEFVPTREYEVTF